MINNYLSALEFEVTIQRIPNVEFFTQQINLPGVSSNPVETENPFNRLVWKPEKLQYAPLEISFIIDENMNNWMEIYRWMVGTTSPQNPKQFRDLKESKDGTVSDISVLILNNKKNANILFTYKDCFPFSLSPVNLDTKSPDVQHPKADVLFTYNYFTIKCII